MARKMGTSDGQGRSWGALHGTHCQSAVYNQRVREHPAAAAAAAAAAARTSPVSTRQGAVLSPSVPGRWQGSYSAAGTRRPAAPPLRALCPQVAAWYRPRSVCQYYISGGRASADRRRQRGRCHRSSITLPDGCAAAWRAPSCHMPLIWLCPPCEASQGQRPRQRPAQWTPRHASRRPARVQSRCRRQP